MGSMAVRVSVICRSFCRSYGITSSYLSIGYKLDCFDITHNLPIFLPIGCLPVSPAMRADDPFPPSAARNVRLGSIPTRASNCNIL
jgi:hypothetical protein